MTHTRSRRRRCALATLLATAITAGPAAADASSPIALDPSSTGAPTELTVDLDPSAAGQQSTSPTGVSIWLPKGMAADVRARRHLCTPAEASAIRCPPGSDIGFGHGVVHVAGYLHPGGEADAVSYVRAFLGQPVAPGDPASVVFEVQLLGVSQIQQAIQQNFGIRVPFTGTVTGRLERVDSGPYGLKLSLDQMPGGISLPAALTQNGVSASFTRLKLQLGAVRFVKHPFFHTYRVATPNGTRTYRVPDHRLIPHYLLRDPRTCRGAWPFQVQLAYPGAPQTFTTHVSCQRAAVPQTPPPSPSAPQGA